MLWNGQSAAKPRIGERSETIPIAGVGLQAFGSPKWGTPKPGKRHGEDIVRASQKCEEHNSAIRSSDLINNITDLTGYYEDKDFFTTRGDARVSVQLARNEHSLCLGRNNRFLIDDPDAPHKLAYQLTKPLKGNLTYDSKGTYSFVLQEVQSTDYDNIELGIADYYKHFPKESEDGSLTQYDDSTASGNGEEDDGKKVWI